MIWRERAGDLRNAQARHRQLVERGDAELGEVFVGPLVKLPRSRRIAGRDVDDHAFPRPGEKDAVGIEKIAAAFGARDLAPAVAAELVMAPAGVGRAEIAIPGDADPIELE